MILAALAVCTGTTGGLASGRRAIHVASAIWQPVFVIDGIRY